MYSRGKPIAESVPVPEDLGAHKSGAEHRIRNMFRLLTEPETWLCAWEIAALKAGVPLSFPYRWIPPPCRSAVNYIPARNTATSDDGDTGNE